MPTQTSMIVGAGRYAPAARTDNPEIEARLGVEPGWIERRTGIRSRRRAAEDEAATDLALAACEAALKDCGAPRSEIGLILLATSTPDHLLPPSAPLLAHRLGLQCGAVDLAGACAGFIYALTLADAFVRVHRRCAVAVAANVLSRRLNPHDRATAGLFGDAAGALVLAPSDDAGTGVLGVDLSSEGLHYDLIGVTAGGSRQPLRGPAAPADLCIEIRGGRTAFTQAVRMMTQASRRALESAGLGAGELSRWIPHQANARILEAVRRELQIPGAKLVSTLSEFGNSSAASIPFSLAASFESDPPHRGERILLTGAGAGMTGGALIYGF